MFYEIFQKKNVEFQKNFPSSAARIVAKQVGPYWPLGLGGQALVALGMGEGHQIDSSSPEHGLGQS